MTTSAPRVLEPKIAAEALVKALGGAGTKTIPTLTIADAAAKSALPLWDAERALHYLLSEYRGHLRVTEDGDLIFRFPNGFTKPWIIRSTASKVASTVGNGLIGVARFVVRAWVAIVLVGYVAIFVAILIALTFTRSEGGGRGRGGSLGLSLVGGVFRVLFEAFFWMFHPFSPFYVRSNYPSSWGNGGEVRGSSWHNNDPSAAIAGIGRGGPLGDEQKVPFYERVNRFFFGPTEPKEDPAAMERKILAEIRIQKGRIGLSDVMRVSGLPREQADSLMSRLMLSYNGTVDVSDEGSITYRFTDIRKTAAEVGIEKGSRPESVWAAPSKLQPFMGNGLGTNLLIILLNAFNFFASYWAIQNGLTIARIEQLFAGIPWEKLAPATTPLALGWVPLIFSIALFVLPLLRALWRPIKARRVARENGRRALVRAILEQGGKTGGVREADLVDAWADAAGSAPSVKAVNREVVALGGDVEMDRTEDGIRYRFPEIEAEERTLEAEREAASIEEAKVGRVVFSSET